MQMLRESNRANLLLFFSRLQEREEMQEMQKVIDENKRETKGASTGLKISYIIFGHGGSLITC